VAELTAEDLRAREWRNARRRRVEIERERIDALKAPPSRRRELEANWTPTLSHGGCYGTQDYE
jgi:hypothetical protein